MTRINPITPDGPYPQPRLYGQEGNAPSRIKIKMMMRIVVNMLPLS
jgi:hypothetical protein